MRLYRRIAWFPIILVPLLLFWPVFLQGKVLYWGTALTQFTPWHNFALNSLASGELPLWNPLLGMGAPLAANYQSALFYPPNWLVLLTGYAGGSEWLAWSQSVLVVLHMIWAGLGMALLVRRLGLGTTAQSVAGLAFGLCSYLVGRGSFFSLVAAISWVPWVLWAVNCLIEDEHRRINALVVCSWTIGMQLLSGHAQTSWYTVLLAGLWMSYFAYCRAHSHNQLKKESHNLSRLRKQPFIGVLKGWIWVGLGVILAGMVAAVQLLPTAEYLVQSQRSGEVGYEFAMTYSYWPWRLLTWLAPTLFGSPVSGDYWGYGNFWEDALYIGMLPVLLGISTVLMVLFKMGSRKNEIQEGSGPGQRLDTRSFTLLLLGILGISMLLALGKNTAVFPWLYKYIPTFDMFQAPTRFSLLAEVSMVVLAAMGVDAWQRPVGRGLYWTRLGTAGAVAVALGAGVAWIALPDIKLTMIRAAAIAGFWAVGVGVLSLTAPKNAGGAGKPVWSVGVIAWVAFDLLAAHAGLNPLIDRSLYKEGQLSPVQAGGNLVEGRIYLSLSDEYTLKFGRFYSFKSFDQGYLPDQVRETLLPNTNLLAGIASVNNFDPLVPGRYERWMEALDESSLEQADALLNLMDVAVVEKLDPESTTGVKWVPRGENKRLRFYTCAVHRDDSEEAWKEVHSGKLDLEQVLVLEGESGEAAKCLPTSGQPQIAIDQMSGNKLSISVRSGMPGWLMVSDVWYPGWRAQVDGQETPVLRADFLFRAVAVPEGARQVVLSYQPALFIWGAVVSLITMIGLVAAIVISRRV